MTRNKIEIQVLAELYDRMVSLLEEAPEHGFLTLKIHMRDGMPLRYETSREESVLIKRGYK